MNITKIFSICQFNKNNNKELLIEMQIGPYNTIEKNKVIIQQFNDYIINKNHELIRLIEIEIKTFRHTLNNQGIYYSDPNYFDVNLRKNNQKFEKKLLKYNINHKFAHLKEHIKKKTKFIEAYIILQNKLFLLFFLSNNKFMKPPTLVNTTQMNQNMTKVDTNQFEVLVSYTNNYFGKLPNNQHLIWTSNLLTSNNEIMVQGNFT